MLACLSTLVTPQCNPSPTMCNRSSCAQVQELPYSHYGDNWEGTLLYFWIRYFFRLLFCKSPSFLYTTFPKSDTVCFVHKRVNTYTAKPVCWNGWISDSYCSLKPLCSGMGEVVAGSYLADPTSPIPSHCAVIILFQSVAVHQLSVTGTVRVKQVQLITTNEQNLEVYLSVG